MSLAVDRVVRNARSTGLTLRETYQEVRATLAAAGIHPDTDALDGYLKDYALAVI